jgi:hypothetical protein
VSASGEFGKGSPPEQEEAPQRRSWLRTFFGLE